MRQEPPIQNGTSGPMNSRPAVSNDPVHVVNGHRAPQTDMDLRRASTMSAGTSNNGESSTRRSSLNLRPTSAPGGTAESSQEESDVDKSRRRPKPLLRSKSDFGPRNEDVDSQEDDSWKDWGARHGFEDHYASEEYVSQLANVSRSFLKL
jgi:regulator-associated protein of mTOR